MYKQSPGGPRERLGVLGSQHGAAAQPHSKPRRSLGLRAGLVSTVTAGFKLALGCVEPGSLIPAAW